MTWLQNRNLHPYLFATFPTLALLAYNIEEVKVFPAFRPLVLSLLVAVLVHLLLTRLLKNRFQAALLTTLSFVAFFTYGQVYTLLKDVNVAGVFLGRHRLLLPIWIALMAGGVILILRRKTPNPALTQALNLFGLVLLVYPLVQTLTYGIRSLNVDTHNEVVLAETSGLRLPAGEAAPDIYYIILDAYARDDILRNDYHVDNRAFLDELEQMGFFIARCSQSNYAQTQLSLASSLNLDYLTALGDFQPGSNSRLGISELIHHNAARMALDRLGYTSVAFETGFKGTQWEDADVYLSPNNKVQMAGQFTGGMTAFEEMLMRTSMGLVLLDSRAVLPQALQPGLNNPNRVRYEMVRFDLEQLRRMPARSGPKFVFAHIVNPHPPYVFEANGEFVGYDKPDDPGYQDQIRHINSVVAPLLRQIIADSPTPPIIILQGDHGAVYTPPNKRMAILNAYYLPGFPVETIPTDISPVNTFRMIFNHYFQTDYEMLENTAYFSVYNRPYEFTIIPNRRKDCR